MKVYLYNPDKLPYSGLTMQNLMEIKKQLEEQILVRQRELSVINEAIGIGEKRAKGE